MDLAACLSRFPARCYLKDLENGWILQDRRFQASVSHAVAAVRCLEEQGCCSQPRASRGTSSEEKRTPQ